MSVNYIIAPFVANKSLCCLFKPGQIRDRIKKVNKLIKLLKSNMNTNALLPPVKENYFSHYFMTFSGDPVLEGCHDVASV